MIAVTGKDAETDATPSMLPLMGVQFEIKHDIEYEGFVAETVPDTGISLILSLLPSASSNKAFTDEAAKSL